MSAGALRNVHLATFDGAGYSELRDAALVWDAGHITWLGAASNIPSHLTQRPWQDGAGGWVLPGLIDCHTHLVYAGNRATEFEARMQGESYQSIAQRGGGIMATVRATRAASEDALLAASLLRVDALLAEGMTTLEIKSGYGLELESERRMLRVARRIATLRPVSVCTTFLGAHALPPEYAGRADDYITAVLDMLRVLHSEGLVDAVDAFCESIAFSTAQVARVFDVAQELGLPVKLHAEQLSNQHGAALLARYRGLSADHLEWLDADGITALQAAGSVAVLLPGAYYYLRETRLPPIAALRAAGVPIAVATDHNPGTSPLTSLLTAANMACVQFGLTPTEALAGITRHAAQALGLADRGHLAVGLRADFALWAVEHPVVLCYALHPHRPEAIWYAGSMKHSSGA